MFVPTIICPHCRAENRPRSLSALDCENCGRSIDPRESAGSAEAFVRKQRKLRRKPEISTGPLESDEADELLEWILELPPAEIPIDEHAERRAFEPRAWLGWLTTPWRRVSAATRRRRREWLYSDTVVGLTDDRVVINHYYWPLGKKRIRYSDIRSFDVRPLKAWHGQFRVHGVDHLGRWYSRDRHRGEKERAIDLDVGRLIHPVLTPDDIDKVLDILEAKATTAAR